MLLSEFKDPTNYEFYRQNYNLISLFEQSPQEQEPSNDEEPEEYKPLKKYQLITRLYDLKNRLNNEGYSNQDLDTILNFSNELSYETLVTLSKGILAYIDQQLVKDAKEKT